MAKKRIEKLLSVDPIGAFEKIKSNYRRYFETAYKFRDTRDDNEPLFEDLSYLNESLYGDREKGEIGLIEKDGNLYKEPYIELLPEYKTAGGDLESLLQEESNTNWPPYFAEFISKGLMRPSDPQNPIIPYEHQFEMLKLAYRDKKNVVITSGTGSGKTEAFLLPLLASLLNEASQWDSQNYDASWYNKNTADEYDKPYQRLTETSTRPAALRAMILYPMNALVNDQMARLRQALDGEDIRQFLDNKYNKNRLFFGRYNGETLGKKDQDNAGRTGRQNCFQKLNNIVKKSKQISQKIADSDLDDDAEYIAPRFPLNGNQVGAEMLTRWDMQSFPPDILITNVSMLSIALMRSFEDSIFSITRDYFDNNPDAVFHLIVDELHLYRGTSGSEVACLIRTFLERIGIPPTIKKDGKIIANPRLRILASSASLSSGEDKTEKFLEEFFGVYNEDGTRAFHVIGQNSEIEQETQNLPINYSDFEQFATHMDANGMHYVDEGFLDKGAVVTDFCSKYKCSNLKEFTQRYHKQIYFDLREAVKKTDQDSSGKDSVRYVPISLSSLAETLECSLDGIRGFFIFRGDEEVNSLTAKYKLPRIRFHQFFKYIEGLWGELQDPDKNDGKCIGKLMYEPVEVINNHKVLELLRCETCGTLYIGGNRMIVDGETKAMLLNTPNLKSIPNRNATPMVQNKLYEDYAIFLPTRSQMNIRIKFPYVDENGEMRKSDAKHSSWKECWLSPDDGSITDYQERGSIHGYLYLFEKTTKRNNREIKTEIPLTDTGRLSALPCQCPFCNKNYGNRIYSKSPIRSFRTGIKRSNQILSKELIYQLNDKKQEEKQQNANQGEYYQTHGKLIGFSDSRQDAAEQSYGIAQEHFRDLVRYFFIKNIENGISDYPQDLKSTCESLILLINQNFKIIFPIIDANIKNSSVNKELKQILQERISTEEKINKINQVCEKAESVSSIPMNRLVSTDGTLLDGDIVKELVKIGVNPAAIDYNDQYYGKDKIFWDQFYKCDASFSSKTPDEMKTQDLDCESFRVNEIKERLISYIFNNCFSKYMGLSVEDAGLGYVIAKEPNSPDEKRVVQELQNELNNVGLNINALDFLNAYIRILGDNHRFKDPDSFPIKIWKNYYNVSSKENSEQSFSKECRKPIEKLTGSNGNCDLGNILLTTIKHLVGRYAILDISLLSFKLVNDDAPYYKCTKCGRVHLHRGMGRCTNTACLEELPTEETGKVSKLRENHFISYDIKNEPREACRIHTEELTGQTDDQTRRLLEFKNIILDDEINGRSISYSPKTKEIDMLNVTTTMEVGVDIGSLQAIFQGNMPPTRYNYQQRVGRGGRRGQAFSAAVTFCRGRSHDSYYYKYALDEITGGKPKDPTLSVNPRVLGKPNFAIINRILLKHILMYAFKDIREEDEACAMKYYVEGDTHGQFGKRSDWFESTRPLLENWLNENRDIVDKLTKYYLSQFKLDDYCNDRVEWCYKDLLSLIDSAVKSSNSEGLAQTMAEAGLLPLYGMPTTIRRFIHGKLPSSEKREDGSSEKYIDRPLELSITEFAPGAIKTKDNGYYRSVGLTVPRIEQIKTDNDASDDSSKVENIDRPDLDPLYDNRCLKMNKEDILQIENKPVTDDNKEKLLVIPKAFRTGTIDNSTGKLPDNTDARSNYTQAIVFVQESNNVKDISFSNADCKIWNCEDKEKTEVWHINDNNGKYFELIRAYKSRTYGSGEKKTADQCFYTGQIKTDKKDRTTALIKNAPAYFDKRFFKYCNDREKGKADWNPNPSKWYKEEWNSDDTTTKVVALGANKVTDVIRLSVINCNKAINLDLETGNAPAIKAAFYSAATLIQRYFADEIDIEPDEIEISVQKQNGKPVVYLSDRLDNGAGFVKMLCDIRENGKSHLLEIMEDIINPNSSSNYIRHLYQHKEECRTACHNCIKSYDNQGLHHVLDWRLGMDLIKLMLDPNYKMGLDDLSATPYGDLEYLMKDIITSVTNAHNYISVKKDGNYYYFIENDIVNNYSYLIHPLWNESQLPRIDCDNGDEMTRAHDTFTLMRKVYTEKEKDTLYHISKVPEHTHGIVVDDDDLG